MGELNNIIDTLDEASDGFAKIADKQQKKMYDEVLLLVKDLETLPNGKVKQSIANLKRLTQIKANLAKLAKDDEWVEGIGKFLQYFTKIQGQQMQYFTKTFAENTLTERAKEKHQLMKQMAVQNTIDGLVGTGLQANVTDKLNDILLRAVTSGEKFADLQQELHDHLMGVDGGTGAFSRYASTYATTAMTQFTGQNNKLLTDDLGLEWFMYVGSNKETTREFCEQLTKKRYIHKSEIPAILQGRIDDYQCAIYPKTGLPYGMIDGTNEDNFQCNCGGWNCRHQLVPVAAAAVPASIRARYKQIKPTLPIGNRDDIVALDLNKDKFELINKYLSYHDSEKVRNLYKGLLHFDKIGNEKETNKLLSDAIEFINNTESGKMSRERKLAKEKITISDNINCITRISEIERDEVLYDYNSDKKQFTPIKKHYTGSKITTKNGAVITMVNEGEGQQNLTPAQIDIAFERMPRALKNAAKDILLLKEANPSDEFWKNTYTDFSESFATGGGGTITFYKNHFMHSPYGSAKEHIIYALPHEAGHNFDKLHGVVSSGDWKIAVENDKKYANAPDFISSYARNANSGSYTEDFADSCAEYCRVGEFIFRSKYPYRYKCMELYGLFT